MPDPLRLEPLSPIDLDMIRDWRLILAPMLRTPYLLTRAHQDAFYQDVVSNRTAPHRYWRLIDKYADIPFAVVGLTSTQRGVCRKT